MSVCIKRTSQPSFLEQQQILSLLSDAFTNDAISRNTLNGFFSGYKSEYDNFILLLKDAIVVGVAIVAKRKINLLNSVVNALSVGPIAISPLQQRQGYSGKLMDAVNEIASDFGVSVIYLQGIDGFYDRHGFFTCSAKAKIIFEVNGLEETADVNIDSMSALNIEDVTTIYKNNANECSCTSLRSKEDWDWLLKYGCQTWYFYEPTVVLYKGRLVGYFCTDEDDPCRIREAIFDQTENGIKLFLAGLKKYCKQKSIDKFELMTWLDSPIYAFAKKIGNAVFMQFFKNNGSQMMKIHNFSEIFGLFASCFPMNYEVEISKSDDGCSVFHIKFEESIGSIKIPAKYFPGLICGFFDSKIIANFDYLPKEIQKSFADLIDNLKPPFFFQGDNY